MLHILWLFLITFFGAYIQTNIGFGLPLIAMLFLPMFLPFSTSVALYQIVGTAGIVYIVLHYRRYIAWRIMLPLLTVSLLTGMAVTLFSMSMEKSHLIVILGAALILISVFSVGFSERISVTPTPRNGAVLGLVAGIGNGLLGISGPPVAIYLLAGIDEKRAYLATLQTFFLISNLTTIAIRTGGGAVSFSHIPLIISGWTGMAAGTFLGLKLFERLPKELLKKLVYAFVGISGAWMIMQELIGS